MENLMPDYESIKILFTCKDSPSLVTSYNHVKNIIFSYNPNQMLTVEVDDNG